MMNKNTPPQPIFDTLFVLLDSPNKRPSYVDAQDFKISVEFLLSYRGSEDTFNSYRKEVDRFLQWLYIKREVTLCDVKRVDIEDYMRFCLSPPLEWIAVTQQPRFIEGKCARNPNPKWRPFLARVSKAKHRSGDRPKVKDYELSDSGKKATLRILSSFFSFLEIEDYIESNPVKKIRQKSQFTRTRSGPSPVRRLSPMQWETVINTCKEMTEEDPVHERGLFILTCLYSMYLRISELAGGVDTPPRMKDFYKDSDQNWWFRTVGKGNKERDITVSADMLKALTRYREFLGLSRLPTLSDDHPLLLKRKGSGAIGSTRQIRTIVQGYFDAAKEKLTLEGLGSEADELAVATTHWLRHTGISDDVQVRPKEHVRDDAGHASSAITDRYVDIERRERHASAKNKKTIPD